LVSITMFLFSAPSNRTFFSVLKLIPNSRTSSLRKLVLSALCLNLKIIVDLLRFSSRYMPDFSRIRLTRDFY
jgi:hypothetical protein